MLSLQDFEADIGPVFFEQIEERVFSNHDSPPAEIRRHCSILSGVVDIEIAAEAPAPMISEKLKLLPPASVRVTQIRLTA